MNSVQVIIVTDGTPKEIASLVLAVQERQKSEGADNPKSVIGRNVSYEAYGIMQSYA